jgi:glycosyltransferase involved in cell wall biosynthesis
MPRVLIVSYPWLPAFSAGVRHVATLARYLPEAGWDPIILSRDWGEDAGAADGAGHVLPDGGAELPSLRLARALPTVTAAFASRDNLLVRWQAALAGRAEPARARRAERLARALLDAAYPLYGAYPDPCRGWVQPAVAAGLGAIRQFGIGAVVSVSSPDSAHIAGGEMARAAGVPWIPVFGELGTFRVDARDGRTLMERFEHRELARRWLRGSFAGVAMSPEMSEHLERNYSLAVETLALPFDPDERRLPPRRTVGSPLRLVHVGRLGAHARVGVLLDAIDLLLRDDHALSAALEVELVGSGRDDELQALLTDRPAASVCRITPRVSPAEAVALQREADVLLSFGPSDALARYPSTFPERLNARRPVLAIADDDSFIGQVLRETSAGEVVGDAVSVAAGIRRALDALRAGGEVPYRGDESVIARYAGPELARRLAGMLDVASAERFGSWQRG